MAVQLEAAFEMGKDSDSSDFDEPEVEPNDDFDVGDISMFYQEDKELGSSSSGSTTLGLGLDRFSCERKNLNFCR